MNRDEERVPDPDGPTGQDRPHDTPGPDETRPFDPPALPDADRLHGVAKLVALEGSSTRVTHTLAQPRMTLGRRASNDVVLPSSSVSKRHALLLLEDGLYYIEDLGSTNGVVVNGVRVRPDSRRRLYHGDNVRIADHLFMFLQESSLDELMKEISSIELDRDKIVQEARELLREVSGDRGDGGDGSRPTAAPS